MARLEKSYTADEMPKSDRDFTPLAPGWYSVTITEADVKNTKAGNGTYIKIRYDVTGPTGGGRVVFGNINNRNPNPTAEEIGMRDLGELMRAVGLARLDDTDQLIGKRLDIKLSIKSSEQYGDSNEVKGYRTNGSTPSASAPSGAAPAASKPPWAK
jgi:hypothetical protein